MAEQPPPTPKKRLTVRTPDEILGMTFSAGDSYVGDHLIAAEQNTVILGPPGIGKSRMWLQTAVANIVKFKALGFDTNPTPGPWLFLQAENSNRRLKFDLEHLRAWVGPERWKEVQKKLYIHTLETDYDGFLALDNPEVRRMLCELTGDLKPSVIGWDCLQSYSLGDLNKDMDMFGTLTGIAQISKLNNPKCCPSVLHHAAPGRQAAARAVGYERGAYARNSKAILGWSRCIWNFAPGTEDGKVIVVSCGKLSDGVEFPPFAIRLNEATMIYEVDRDFDMNLWRAEMARAHPNLVQDDTVAELAGSEGKTKKELRLAVMETCQVGQSGAYQAIKRAEKRKKIKYLSGRDVFVAAVTGG